MSFAIITSSKDTAGVNIKERLLENFSFRQTNETFDASTVFKLGNAKLYALAGEAIFAENIDQRINADFFIFATRHSSKSRIPSLTAHSIGNWSRAEYGGRDNELVISMPSFIKTALIKLNEFNSINFDIGQEATHHGPFLQKPSMFIELGSTEEQWSNKNGAWIIAKTINHLITQKPAPSTALFAIGGTHINEQFKKILKTDYSIGHICPKYAVDHLNERMLLQAIERNSGEVDTALLDWNGLGKEKQRILQLLKENDIDFLKADKL